MSVVDFLASLRDLGVRVWSEGEKLRYRGPEEALTPSLLSELSRRKAEIMELLRQAAAGVADTATGAPPAPPLVPLPAGERGGPLPLSFAQQRLWFLHQLQPESASYVEPAAFRLGGALSVPALAATFAGIVRRHEVLRTTFAEQGGQPVQIVAAALSLPLPVVDLAALPPALRDIELQRLAAAEARRPFDLSRGPLLRTTLLRLDGADHVVLLAMHHLVHDGLSFRVFAGEMAAFYDAFVQGRPPQLPDLRLQYADFAIWQRRLLQGERLAAELGYWRRELAGAPEVLDGLPFDHPRPAIPSHRGGAVPFAWPRELSAALAEAGRRLGATPFMTLLAAFDALLFRYTGQDDLCVGSPVAGRSRPELAGLIGFFVNTQVLRVRLDGATSFADLVGRVRDSVLGAQGHQDLPFERLVEELQPERNLSHNPLFQVGFALQDDPRQSLALAGLAFDFLELHTGTAKFDLALPMTESAAGLFGHLEYSSDLFDRTTAQRLVDHLRRLAEGAAAQPEARLADLPLLSAAERQQVEMEWNDSVAAPPAAAGLHHLVARQADLRPDAVAVAHGDAGLTYGELSRRVHRLARRLRALGAEPEVLVGLCVDRSAEIIVAVLAILEAGAAYLPLDPAYPPERLAFMLEESRTPLLVGDSRLLAALPTPASDGPLTVPLDRDWGGADAASMVPAPVESAPGNLAYVIYTSGSTGRPKGVLVRHGGACRVIDSSLRLFGIGPGSRVLQLSSLSFDASVLEIFTALGGGGTLLLVDQETRLSGERLAAEMTRQEATAMAIPPSLLDTVPAGGLPALASVIIGGESCSAETAARWSRRHRLFNCYAPTETTIYSTTELCGGPFPPPHGLQPGPSMGRPIAGSRVHLLDRDLRPVPMRALGEIFIGGEGVARGYHRRPELTAERFVPDPWSPEPGARLYRTGDLARSLADGRLEFAGRNDLQIKIRGLRIEPGEIEAALLEHPAVREAVVVAAGDGAAGSRLAAYVVPAAGARVDGQSLGRFLRGKLPPALVPSAFVSLAALPLTANGKVDRRALPAPDDSRAEAPAVPESLTGQLLAGIWCRVLGRERVGAGDDFFALGGHSLLAVQVASAVRQTFRVELPLRSFFEAPSLAALAQQIDAAINASTGAGEAPGVPPFAALPRGGPLPLSFAQERLWFIDRLEPGSAAYNMPAAVCLDGRLQVPALAAALRGVVARHEVLRATFPEAGGRAVQVVAPPEVAAVPLPVVDLAALPVARREAETLRLARAEALHPFDLTAGPLLRLTLLRAGAHEHVLLLTFHHIVFDGWSTAVFFADLAELYEAALTVRPAALPPLPLQYADYAAWQRRWLQGAAEEDQLAYWRAQLAGLPPLLELPTDLPRPAVLGSRGGERRAVLPLDLAQDLRRLCQREGVTLFMALLAALDTLLLRSTGREDLAVGSVVANRNRVEVEGLIGFFVNTQVLRTQVAPGLGFRQLLERVRETALGAYAHQDLPFERLFEVLQPERDLSYTPLFQVLLALQTPPVATVAFPGLALRRLDVPAGTAKFDLTWFVEEVAAGLAVDLRYRVDLFHEPTVLRLLGGFERLLRAVVADPERPLASLSLLADAERHQLLREWCDTGAAPALPPVHRLFSAWAAEHPDRPAVVHGDAWLTFGELESRANRLARHLRRLQVGPGAVVAFALERSVEMLVAVLGALKAGAAYLPLDPGQPTGRLQHLLADAGAAALISRRPLSRDLVLDGIRVVDLDADAPALARLSGSDPGIEVSPDHLAYVLYTSGSTGLPKGVMVRHGGLSNLLRALAAAVYEPVFGAAGTAATPLRVAVNAPIVFDASVKQWVQVAQGHTLWVTPEEARFDAAELLAEVRRREIDALDVTPSQLKLLLAGGLADAAGGPRLLLVGGEALDAAVWAHLAALPGCAAFNVYGPTECTVDTAVWRAGGPRPLLGRPLAGVRTAVLDRWQNPVPVGVFGELAIGGAGVARGYLGRPDLTARAFVPDGGEPGERLYRSGDLVRQLPDGRLEFLGRIDRQVKVRGFRIELQEIESALVRHPGVADAFVLVREDEPGRRRLAAYLVPRPGAEVEPAAVQEDLRRRLPEYMLPAVWVVLPALPLTPNGKVDVRALPVPDGGRPLAERDAAAPRTAAERALARVWAEVLRLPEVGIHDNFFELGGDSIISIQVVSRARQAGFEVTPKDLFLHQTVAELAARARAAATPAAEQGPVTGPAPLTPIQLRFFELGAAEPHHFNQSVLLATAPEVDAGRLERVLAGWMAHHDALRLRFRQEGGVWTQTFAAPGPSHPLLRVDLSALPEAARPAAGEAAAATLQASLDLAAGRLLAAGLFLDGAGRPGRLLLAIHHLAVDGVSWRVLLEDLDAGYSQLGRGEPLRFVAKTASFKAWAESLARHARTPGLLAELPFWLAASAATPPLPRDRDTGVANGAGTWGEAHTLTVSLAPHETRVLLQEVPRAFRARVDEALLAALVRAFAAWTGEGRLRLDLEGHGRDTLDGMDLSRTVGWFTAVYPVLLEVGEGGPAADLAAVRERLRAVPGGGAGYGLLRYLAGDGEAARLRRLPEAEVGFNYMGRVEAGPDGPFRLTSEPSGPERGPRTPRRYLLEVGSQVQEGRLVTTWVYGPAHRRRTVEALARSFQVALRELIAACPAAAPRYLPADFPLAGLDERRLAALVDGRPRIEDIYPLSPLQQGLLFHALYAPGSEVYSSQLTFTLAGDLRVDAFRRAWQRVMDRHAFFRTSFHWEGLEEPLQVVHAGVALPWEEHDLRSAGQVEAEERAAAFQAADQARGFVLHQAPLLRLALLRLGDDVWRCVWSHHHLLADGWSLALVLREVFAFYGAFVAGRELEPPRPRPYRDYIEWLRRQDLAAAEAFWRATLRGFTAATPLAVDRPAAAAGEEGTGTCEALLPAPAAASLAAFGQRHQLTLSTLVHGAWALLLGRYSGETDVVFGSTCSGRPAALEGVESMLGLFINTLPVRAGVPHGTGTGAAGWLRDLQLRLAEMRDFEHSPLVEVQGWSEVPRGQQLFHSILVFENFPVDAALTEPLAAGGPLAIRDYGSAESTNYPLSLMAAPGEGLQLRLFYDRAVLDTATVARLAGHLRTLLEGLAAAAGGTLVDALPLLTAGEREQLLMEWNRTREVWPDDRCLHELLAEQARRQPAAVAVDCEGRRWTYGELNARANRLAHHLRRLGVGPETLVGLCMERSLEMVAAVFGIFKAGAAYLPLDPTYPRERLELMLADAGVPVLVTQASLLESLPPHAARTVCPGDGFAALAAEPEDDPAPLAGPGNAAYVIYTSGSSGRPKGVLVQHGGLRNLAEAQVLAFGLEPADHVLQFASLSFDAAIFEITMAVRAGAALYLGRAATLMPGPDLERFLREGRITQVTLPPSALGALPAADLPDLHTVVVAGEACPAGLVDRWAGGRRFFNAYGPTEATVWSTAALCAPGGGKPAIGHPVANHRTHVVGADGGAVPVGVPGELHIGGAGLARCYLRRPELTAERFVPDPFCGEPGARLYRSGDLVRYRPDGDLEFLDRIDFQVKVRGFRIEPGEIEAVLRSHPAVGEAAVVKRAAGPGDERLVAYVVPAGDLPTGELRDFLRSRLPDYMIPSAFVVLPSLPLSPNGKIDRRALPDPGTTGDEGAAFVAPRDRLELAVARIWADVLGVGQVGAESDFFVLGGHSLLAIQAISRLREELRVDLPLRALFESSTVAALAAEIGRLQEAGGGEEAFRALPVLVPRPEDRFRPFPLNETQQAYWIGRSGEFELGNVATHAYLELESADLDLARFQAAWQRLVDRHDMLRAIVLPEGEQQVLQTVPPVHIELQDLSTGTAETAAEALAAVRRRMSHQVLPADRWPLFELCATRLPGGRLRLHISFDALIADVWSGQILFQELLRLYRQPDAELPAISLTFRDYLLAELALHDTDAFRRDLAYWRARLDTLPPAPELPLARAAGSLDRPRFVRLADRLGAETWRRLKARASRAGITPSGLLLAAYADVLAVWSKTPRFTLNLTLFNRLPLHPEVEEILGDFTHLVLLEADGTAGADFASRARRLQEQLWDDLDHRLVNGVRVLRELAARHGAAPAMPVVFTSVLDVVRRGRPGQEGQGGLEQLGELVHAVTQTPQVWIDCGVAERDGALHVKWDVVEELFPPGLPQEMFGAFGRLLQRLAGDDEESWHRPGRRLVPPEQLALQAAINATAAPLEPALLHELFAARVTSRAPAPAVVAQDLTLTYGELERRVNRLARRLRRLGARPGHLVAVVMEKGWEQVVAVLAVVAAGGAYMPVSPRLPAERRMHLLERGEVELALTQPELAAGLDWPPAVRVVPVERTEPEELDGEDASPLEPVQRPEDLAYVIFTSGSTGLPKGVSIDHRGAVNTVLDVDRRFGIGPEDRVLALSDLGFDLSVWDVFGLLAAGGTIVMPGEAAGPDPAHWAELLERHRVTVWNSVPALVEVLVEYLAGRGAVLPASLRLVMMSGDWIPVGLPDQLRALRPGIEVVSLGGATEASIWSILFPVGAVDPSWKSIPYGRPMLNQTFHVLDGALEPRPVWVPGELYIGGAGLAHGYWRDAERTAASFVVDPWTGERLYKTGDWGRWLPGGDIEFLGREDLQVKIRGFRIELGEIEAALVRHPGVRTAVVQVIAPPGGERRLVAWAVPEPEGAPTPEDLERFLRQALPEYMVPARIRLLEALPLTANGKVDRKALALLGTRPEEGPASAAAAGPPPGAERIAALMARVLGRDRLAPEDDLLALGATSVEMIRVANLVERELGFRPRIAQLYAEPTAAGLARLHAEHLRRPEAAAAPAPADWKAPDLIVEPEEREAFKRSQPGLRADGPERARIVLPGGESEEELRALFAARRSHRHFDAQPVPAEQLGRLFGRLRQVRLDGHPKYLYPSAGGLYPVQTYLHVKAGRVAGLPAGVYYHHPATNELVALAPGAELDPAIHSPLVNRPIFERAAFSVFFFARMAAIAPLYGESALPFATIEAGCMTQALMTAAPECGLGLCPTGGLDFDRVRPLFALADGDVLIHSLVGGLPEAGTARPWPGGGGDVFVPAPAVPLAPLAGEEREEGEL